jgi:hypothetical protein
MSIRRRTLSAALSALSLVPITRALSQVPRFIGEVSVGGVDRVGGEYINQDLLVIRAAVVAEVAAGQRARPLIILSAEALNSNRRPTNCISVQPCTPFFPDLTGGAAAGAVAFYVTPGVAARLIVGGAQYAGTGSTHVTGPLGGLGTTVTVIPHLGIEAEYRIVATRFRDASIQLRAYTIGVQLH